MPIVTSVARSLPPSGTASGDLSGTYPGPTVAKVNGIAVSGTPSTGYVPTATSASAATWQAAGGALPVPSLQYFLSGPAVTIANGGNGTASWGSTIRGSTLVDLTTPTQPAVIVGGIYAVTVNLAPTGNMSANGYFDGSLELDANDVDSQAWNDSRLATVAKPQPRFSVSLTAYVPTGEIILLTLHNYDGVNSVDFRIAAASIQRLT